MDEKWQPADKNSLPDEIIPVTVDLSKATRRTTQICTRRKQDARFWQSLSPPEQDAMGELYRGYKLAALQGFFVVTNLSGSGGGKVKDFYSARDETYYLLFRQWEREAKEIGLKIGLALDIIARGMTVNEAARNAQTSWYLANKAVREGLGIYAKMRVWK